MLMTFTSINGKDISENPILQREICKYFGMPMVHKRGRTLKVMREMCENPWRKNNLEKLLTRKSSSMENMVTSYLLNRVQFRELKLATNLMPLTIKDQPLSLIWQYLGFVSRKFAANFLNWVSAYSSGY